MFLLLSISKPLLAVKTESHNLMVINYLSQPGLIPIYYCTIKNSPIIDITLMFDAGSRRDDSKYGLAYLTAEVLDEGTKHFNADQIAEKFSSAGAQYHAHVTRDMTTLNLRSLNEAHYFEKNLGTFLEVLQYPSFTASTTATAKANTLVTIAESFSSVAEVVNNKFYQALYQNTPYAHPIIGTKTSIAALTHADLVNFFKQYYVAANAKLVIVGDRTPKQLSAIAKKITLALNNGKAAPPFIHPLSPHRAQYNYLIPFPTPQTNLYLGQIGIAPNNSENYFALMVGSQILGGSTMTSRLYMELREKRGLTYGIDSAFLPLQGLGPFIISLQTRQSESITAEKIVRNVFLNFLQTGPSEEELKKIKKYLLGSFPLHFTNNRAIAMQIIPVAFYNLPLDYFKTYPQKINAVTTTAIKGAFQQHFFNKPLIKIEAHNTYSREKK